MDRQSGSVTKRQVPRWARICAILGALLMVVSGGGLVGTQVLVSRYSDTVKTEDLFGDGRAAGAAKQPVSDIKGPLNILLVGIDPRDAATRPLADSIMVAHVSADLRQVTLFSLARDLVVDIPAFDKTGFQGGRDRINAAMSYGSKVPNGKPNVAYGFELLSKTVAARTGIKRFDAGAIINFGGFKKIVDAMGGVTMTIDERTVSEHLKPDGSPRDRRPECWRNDCEHPYIGPQAVYEKGSQHLKGWQALDFVRQRYGLKGTDYARQRHQQQFVKAMAEQALSRDVVTNPVKLDRVLRAAGESLIFNGRGHGIVDWAFALKGVDANDMTIVRLPARSVITGGKYRGEALKPITEKFFEAVNNDTVDRFLLDHPEFVNRAR